MVLKGIVGTVILDGPRTTEDGGPYMVGALPQQKTGCRNGILFFYTIDQLIAGRDAAAAD